MASLWWWWWSLSLVVLFGLLAQIAGDCGPPNAVALTTVDPVLETAPEGTEVIYTCDLGFEFRTENEPTYTSTCQADGQWSNVNDCEVVICSDLPSDALTNAVNPTFTYGSVVTMDCSHLVDKRIPGVPVGQSLTVECLANKTWSNNWEPTSPGCIEVACINPMPNAQANNENTAIGLQTQFICNAGYFFVRTDDDEVLLKDLTCDGTIGEWVDSTNTAGWSCEPAECPELTTTFSLTTMEVKSDKRVVSSSVRLVCITGHEFNDSSTEKMTTCQGNQTWSYEPENCLPRSCNGVQDVEFAVPSTTDDWFEVAVNFTCMDGFKFPDQSTWREVRCNEFGKWSERLPDCTNSTFDIKTNFVPLAEDAEDAEVFGTAFFVVFGLLFLCIIIFDILTFKTQMDFLKRNLSSRCKCLRDGDEESEIDSLDGDEIMRESVFSLGKGRITPAPSTIDLQTPDKSKTSSLNHVQDLEAVNEEEQDESEKKPIIPRTRLLSAKNTIQRALSKVVGATQFTRATTVRQKNQFKVASLPLGEDNYGKVIEPRPPSPEAEDEDGDSSEYTDESTTDDEQ